MQSHFVRLLANFFYIVSDCSHSCRLLFSNSLWSGDHWIAYTGAYFEFSSHYYQSRERLHLEVIKILTDEYANYWNWKFFGGLSYPRSDDGAERLQALAPKGLALSLRMWSPALALRAAGFRHRLHRSFHRLRGSKMNSGDRGIDVSLFAPHGVDSRR